VIVIVENIVDNIDGTYFNQGIMLVRSKTDPVPSALRAQTG
jgi:hypothetical protein